MGFSYSFFFVFLGLCIVCEALTCGEYDFPCDDGTCIDEALWCDSDRDCLDGSDEAYCQRSTDSNNDPNKCPGNYFKCGNGMCIPRSGLCNGYASCDDHSDETDCGDANINEIANNTIPRYEYSTEYSYADQITEIDSDYDLSSETPLATHRPETIPNNFIQFDVSDFASHRKLARDWLASQRTEDYDWGEDTPRAVIALQMSRTAPYGDQDQRDLLMTKQLEIRLAIALTRNQTKEISLTDLALYINALTASCKNPRNFYGYDLVSILRQRVDAVQKNSFVNPLVHLTLCVSNETSYEDYKNSREKMLKRKQNIDRFDMQALDLLMTSCILKLPIVENSDTLRTLAKPLLKKIAGEGLPGNVYEMALLMQALNHAKVGGWGISKAIDFILKKQQPSGSFGDILATYYVLPILSGRSLFSLDEHCINKYKTDLTPIEVLKNTKKSRIDVHYGLFYGDPIEVSQMLKIQVAQGSSFLDVMRLAQEIDPNYRFLMDNEKNVPLVYSIGGRPNDAEKGMYWTLYMGTTNNTLYSPKNLVPFTSSIKDYIPHSGDQLVFWMKYIN